MKITARIHDSEIEAYARELTAQVERADEISGAKKIELCREIRNDMRVAMDAAFAAGRIFERANPVNPPHA